MQNSSRFQWQLQPLPNSTLSGDQITLPPSCISAILSGQDGSDNISYPMTFELLQEQQEKSSIFYGAVREFTADEGTIGLSPHFYNQFIMNTSSSSGGSSSSSRIEEEEATVLLLKVSLKTLPKATSMVLVQDSSSSSSSSSSPPQVLGGDVRSVLESMLRQNYSTLTLNSVLQVVDPESDLNFTTSSPTFTTTPISNTNAATPDPILFRIVKLEPASGVLCLDVDIEVDIQPNPASLTASAISAVPASHWKITRHQMNLTAPLPHNLDNNGKDNIISSGVFESSIDAGSSCFVQVNNPTKLLKFGVEVTPSSPSGDCDLFISESVHQPSYKDHDWYNVDIGPSSCTFRLSDTGKKITSGHLFCVKLI